MSEYQQKPAAVSVRGILKLPTGSLSNGVGTGKPDFAVDAIVSKELQKKAEVSGYLGWDFRGSPDGFDGPNGAFRWGFGVGVPSRSALRFTGEINGEAPSSGTINNTGARIVAIDSTLSPLVTNVENLTRATLGLTYQAKNGFFAGAGVSWNFPTLARNTAFAENGENPSGDYVDWQFRIGYPPGRARVRAAAATACANTSAGAAGAGSARSDRACGLRSVHGGSRQEFNRDGDGAGLDQLLGHLSLGSAERNARAAGGAPDAVDGPAIGRHGAGDRHRDLPERRQDGVGDHQHPGDSSARPHLHVRRRALRLRPLLAAAGSDPRAR